jgi:hypothetical protein
MGAHQPVDLGRVDAAFDQPLAHDREVGIGLLEFQASAAVTFDHAHRALVSLEISLRAVGGVAGEIEDRVLLRFRPRALGGDEGAPRGEELRAVDREPEEEDHDRDEQPDDQHRPASQGKHARCENGLFLAIGHRSGGIASSWQSQNDRKLRYYARAQDRRREMAEERAFPRKYYWSTAA